jgi:putative colanic acid biosynthesis UDP-glucose lipid carrier transferase
LALAKRVVHNPYTSMKFVGFFDDRLEKRAVDTAGHPILGRFDQLADFVQRQHVHVIYLSLPMATQERTLRLLNSLSNTTASIYFVPDQFVTELIQSRTSSVVDIPVIAVCETPFVGINGLLKRASDLVLATGALVVLSPVFLLITLLVLRSSPGPAIFRQRRYGLDGQEIIVYKFRSMRVGEDGPSIKQAQRNDSRTTRIGAFLRKTSLDELPQLVNVLQGRMSVVGPRPHAVAHNELYRKVITGYMVRHKVRPGITGWAQVNGLRGETETVDKMEARIRHDIEYLRNWSLRLDLHILAKTVALVFHDRHAY